MVFDLGAGQWIERDWEGLQGEGVEELAQAAALYAFACAHVCVVCVNRNPMKAQTSLI
mgnify:CR=1 FL=1